MAQALYDQHPLDEYLKESGDRRERVPGAFTDASDDEAENIAAGNASAGFSLHSSSLADQAQILRQWTTAIRNIFISPSDDFAERFKYDLISSNLLSSSVNPSPPPAHSQPTLSSPGRSLPGELKSSHRDNNDKTDEDLKPLSSAFVVFGLAALVSQHRITALLALLMSFSFAKAPGIGSVKHSYIPQMFEALDSLKSAGSAWDTAVNEAITIVEREENSAFFTASTSAIPSPSSALRIALHSTLVTTQQQCDNVRPLLAALTSPLELSQLSEMYAPPSPSRPSFTLQTRPTSPRSKHPSLPENTISLRSQTSTSEKRQTWNGSHAHLTGRHVRTPSAVRKKDRRRSDLSTFTDVSNVPVANLSSPPRSPSLAQVMEEHDEDEDKSHPFPSSVSFSEDSPQQDSFGTAALYLRRKRRVSAVEALGLTSPRSVPALRDSTRISPSSLSSSRFTSLSSVRHPFSLNALHHALQGALASRRYACAHLLALRFSEDLEDETYWENVRSVTGLLTSTLEDAAARLNEALAAADELKRQDGQPTPESSVDGSPVKTPADDLLASSSPIAVRNSRSAFRAHASKPSALLDLQGLSPTDSVNSFAPIPSAVTRFASHVDAVSSSLNDARDQLLECVQELRNAHSATEVVSLNDQETKSIEASEESVLQSYERLRKELGFALRECERGRAALLDIFEARRMRNRSQDDVEEVDGSESSSEHARFHMLSGSSKDSNDKTDPDPLTPGDGSPIIPTVSLLEDASNEKYVDDATQHLLLSASSAHLPPPGLEQVFEGEPASVGAFNRERSKLSREERIKRMKEKRESMTGRGLAAHLEAEDDGGENKPDARKGWGPSTDVVEELKDVIWKVGERRRKFAAAPAPDPSPSNISPPVASVTITNPSSSDSSNENDYDTPLCTA